MCVFGMRGLGLVFGLEAVFCVCWVGVLQNMEWGEGHGSSGHVASGFTPKAHVFTEEPEMFVSVNLSGLETGKEHAREELVVSP